MIFDLAAQLRMHSNRQLALGQAGKPKWVARYRAVQCLCTGLAQKTTNAITANAFTVHEHVCDLQMLQHAWTYKPMVHDVLGMQSNSVTVEEKGGAGVLPGASTKKRYEVSLDTIYGRAY